MELTTIEAGSGKVSVQIPAKWLRQSLLEGGEKLHALIEAVKEMERFDFKHVVYPELYKKHEQERQREALRNREPIAVQHVHNPATINMKMQAKGVKPYCLNCGEIIA